MSENNINPEQLGKELKDAYEKIHELKIFRSIVEDANDGIVIVQEGLIKYVNVKLAEITGLSIEEVLETPFSKYIHPSVLPQIVKRYQQRMAGLEVPSIYETSLKIKSGDALEVEINAKLIDYLGKPADLVIVRDLSERRKSDLRLKNSLTFIDSAPDAIMHFDSELNLIDINTTGLKMFFSGTKREELIGKNIKVIVPDIENTGRYYKYLEVLKTGESVLIDEFAAHPKFGNRLLSVRAFRLEDGLGIITSDITNQKRIEERLMTFSSFIDSTPDSFYLFNNELKLVDINPSGIKGFSKGTKKDDIIGMHFTEIVPDIDSTDRYKKYLKTLETGVPVAIREYPVRSSLGIKYFSSHAFKVKDGLGIITSEITDLKLAEKALRQSEIKYQTLVERMEEAVFLEDVNGKISFMNPKAVEIVGYTEEEILGKHWTYFTPENEIEKSMIESAKRPKGISSTYESAALTKDGKSVPIKVTATPLFTEDNIFNGVLCVFTDITEIKQAEEIRRISESKFRAIVEQSQDGITLVNEEGLIIEWNHAQENFSGIDRENAINKKVWDIQFQLVPLPSRTKETYEEIKNITINCLKNGTAPWLNQKNTFPIELPDGSIRFMQQLPFSLTTPRGMMLCSITRDITEQTKMERALISSVERYRRLIELSPNAITIADLDMNILTVNQQAVNIHGFDSPTEMVGLKLFELIPIQNHPKVFEFLNEIKEKINIKNYETELLRKDGTKFPAELDVTLLHDGKGEPLELMGITRDITERKIAEAQLKKVKKEEELYHSMQSHFIKNDLQKLSFLLELNLFENLSPKERDNNVKEAINICHRASENIDTVNKIFSVLQKEVSAEKKEISLIQKLYDFSHKHQIPLKLDLTSLDIQMLMDDYFNDFLNAIFNFIGSNDEGEVSIIGSKDFEGLYYLLTIKENRKKPLPHDVCNRLLTGIKEEKWESLGHYIGLTLASVIIQYYGGKIIINPMDNRGNEFSIYLPSILILQ